MRYRGGVDFFLVLRAFLGDSGGISFEYNELFGGSPGVVLGGFERFWAFEGFLLGGFSPPNSYYGLFNLTRPPPLGPPPVTHPSITSVKNRPEICKIIMRFTRAPLPKKNKGHTRTLA